jgi:hypothetical protein
MEIPALRDDAQLDEKKYQRNGLRKRKKTKL